MTEKNIEYVNTWLQATNQFSSETTEATLIKYVCENTQMQFHYSDDFEYLRESHSPQLLKAIYDMKLPLNIELFIELFEALLEKGNISENGIVFTPQYIAEYIASNALSAPALFPENPTVIDPGCGCGIFLISAAREIHRKTQRSYEDIFSNCIYGIDLDPDNVRRCKIVLNLFLLMQGESNEKLTTNIACTDSLKCKWTELFAVDSFEFIIGNPPYVNTHDMTKDTAKFLKATFATTNSGVFNLFYAFVEYAMLFLSNNGELSYIVPNNFLTIKSAAELRRFITKNVYLARIIDFADNMVFKPVRTYNCIIELRKNCQESFEYCVLEKSADIKSELQNITFEQMNISMLDENGWKLVDRTTFSNLRKIESQPYCIRNLIRTGIATLRDDVYIVDFDGENYFKLVDGKRYPIEPVLVKRLFKIPDLKNCTDIAGKSRYIIFPYKKGDNGFQIIHETDLQQKAPLTYQYLLARKSTLDERDKGKGNPIAWYAYGRTQGLNKYGVKLMFPTFASHPRFTLIDDEYALFCNGYAVFESDYMDMALLSRILNSQIMHYYVSNTSYAIEGGYYCYQKKYIEKFTIPFFSDIEIAQMKEMDSKQLDEFLLRKYGISA